METLRCEVCGGDIRIEGKFGRCIYCKAQRSLPDALDDKKTRLFNSANEFRMKDEFDKAEETFEEILKKYGSDAEAYWGVVLSKFGIEYVEDPKTYKRIPTCHRVQSESILSDLDYKAALKYSTDGYTRFLYEQEAENIAKIQKNILVISNKEDPYDVFICYKETDATGQRSVDSILAQEIYYRLEKENLKVFFSRISL